MTINTSDDMLRRVETDPWLDRIQKSFRELKDMYLEDRLYNRGISSIAKPLRVWNIRRVKVAEQDDDSAEFNQAIHEAEDRGVLSRQEYDRLLDTDMIVQCNRSGSTQDVYMAIEATYGVTNRDITQVKNSESALQKVFPNAEIHPALYFINDLPDGIRKRCGDENIHLIRVDNLR